MSTYAIGDVQGCFAALTNLLDRIAFDPAKDRLWFVGDLVNRGPESAAVLRFVKGLGPVAVTVLGNHDVHLVAVAEGLTQLRREDTLQDVLQAPDRADLLDWLRRRSLAHFENGFLLVHGGLFPDWTSLEAVALAREVAARLRSDEYRDFLRLYYSSQLPLRWSEDLRGLTRLGVILSTLVRMRVCTPTGEMNPTYKGPPNEAPPGYLPWFEVPGRQSADTIVVCGHWAALGLQIRPNLFALDSGCVWGRKLVAIRLEDRQVFQVPCRPGRKAR